MARNGVVEATDNGVSDINLNVDSIVVGSNPIHGSNFNTPQKVNYPLKETQHVIKDDL
jgi:hypothetical protein